MEELQLTAEEIVRKTESVLPTVPPLNTPTPYTITPYQSATNTPTLTPTLTSTATFTPTVFAQVYMTGDTNCREGPGTHYGFVTLLKAGQTAEIVGRDRTGHYWVVDNPNGEGRCWIWNYFAEASGPLIRVAALNAPPTRTLTRTPTSTPKLLASIRYYQITTCDGTDALVVRIYNYSRREFKSWRAQVYETPVKTLQTTVEGTEFSHSSSSCKMTMQNLDYRTSGFAIIPFDANTTDRYLVEFEVCAENPDYRDCLFYGFYVNSPYITSTPTLTPTATETPITPSP
ncbi:MAG: SH3 domain-containing protein [Anaerolineales bacterium]